MTRCQHCNKLTHSEDVWVEYDIKDHEKITELQSLVGWKSPWEYWNKDYPPNEVGKLKCGDIYLHFLAKKTKNDN
jgi:hypothetical protein